MRVKQALRLLSCTLILVALCACGGGSTSVTSPVTSQQPQQRQATLSFLIESTARLEAPVQGLNIAAYMPAGVTVATDAGSNSITNTSLTAGSGITSPSRLVFGTYSADKRKVKIIVATTEESFRGGEFAKLSITCPSTILSVDDFMAANAPTFSLFEAAGYAPGTGTVDLSGHLHVSLRLSFF